MKIFNLDMRRKRKRNDPAYWNSDRIELVTWFHILVQRFSYKSKILLTEILLI